MGALPPEIVRVLRVFDDVFSERVWDWVQVLVIGAILTPGQRAVAAVLRVMGLSGERQYQNYHRVLNRARWSSRELSRRLLVVLVETFVSVDEPVVIGMDETIERRRGAKIAAKGIYRDPVRSSKSHFVKASGLRWISMQVLAEVPWAGRIWGLPFLTVLAPSYRYNKARGRRHNGRDAEAIAEAATRPTMRFVELKSEAQLDMQSLHRARDLVDGDGVRLARSESGYDHGDASSSRIAGS